jgi:hypothetical protein
VVICLRLGALCGVLFLTVVSAFCGRANDAVSNLRQEASALEGKTVPPGSWVLSRSGPLRSGWSVTKGWEFETEWSAETYSRWVVAQLVESEFKVLKSSEAQLSFNRRFKGDTESLSIESVSRGGSLHVRVSFTSYPD